MKVFIFEDVEKVSCNYHEGGGLLIVAESEERARELAKGHPNVELPESDWKDVVVILASRGEEERIIVFPDAGCC